MSASLDQFTVKGTAVVWVMVPAVAVTVTVYAPAVVPGLELPPPPPLLPLPPPHPSTPTLPKSASKPSMRSQLRRRLGTAKKPSRASAVPPATGHKNGVGAAMLLVAAVV